MPRYYVKKDEKWNVFSSIVDDFLYSDFMSFEELKAMVIGEVVVEKLKDLETLLTNRPKLNTMPFSEAMEIINCKDEPQTCYTCEYEWRDSTDEPCVYCYNGSKYKPKDEPQKHCHRPNNVACHPEQGDMWCRGCDYWYANEPQAERSE